MCRKYPISLTNQPSRTEGWVLCNPRFEEMREMALKKIALKMASMWKFLGRVWKRIRCPKYLHNMDEYYETLEATPTGSVRSNRCPHCGWKKAERVSFVPASK